MAKYVHSLKLEAIKSKYSRGLETRLVRATVVRANFVILFEMSLVLRPSSDDSHILIFSQHGCHGSA